MKKENLADPVHLPPAGGGDRALRPVTVFRDGRLISSMRVCDTCKNDLIRQMVNRELTESYPAASASPGEAVLTVKNLNTKRLKDVSFTVRRGERLGFAGLVGAGRTETARRCSARTGCCPAKSR